MKSRFLFTIFIAIITLYPFASNALTVLPAPPQRTSSAESFAQGFAEGFTKSFSQSYQEAKQAKMAEQKKIIETRNYIYIYEMTRDYDPEYHDEFVSCIERSTLPEDQKLIVICQFNDIFLKWKKEKEAN